MSTSRALVGDAGMDPRRRRRGRPAPRTSEWCPGLPDAVAFLAHLQWESIALTSPWYQALRDRWETAVPVVWTSAALQVSAKALLDIGWVADEVAAQAVHLGGMADTTRWPLTDDLWPAGVAPECWWTGDGGLIGLKDTTTGATVPIRAVVVWPDRASGCLVLLAADDGGQPWVGLRWPAGMTREAVLEGLEASLPTVQTRLPEGARVAKATMQLASVLTLGVLAGLLARSAGLVAAVDVTATEGHGMWACLPEELPQVLPTERVS